MAEPDGASPRDILEGMVRTFREDRYAILALSIILFLITFSFDRGDRPTFEVASLYTLIVLAGLYAVRGAGYSRLFGIVLGAILVIGIWIEFAIGIRGNVKSALGLADVFFLFLFMRALGVVFAPTEVRTPRISAAICGYMVSAILFASVYTQILWIDAEAFRGLTIGEDGQAPEFTLLYFSFVTQTTLGYGDISPVNPQAQALAMVQSTLGVVFIATTIASLVARRDGGRASDT